LAAGGSSRLGQPKQLVEFNGKAMLQHCIDEVKKLEIGYKVVVLGAYADQIKVQVRFEEVVQVMNSEWKHGMAGSLKAGVSNVLDLNRNTFAIFLLVGDQPFLTSELLEKMKELMTNENDIIACTYHDVVGVPVLFGKRYFDEIMSLEGDQGAKSVLNKHIDKVKTVEFENGIFDLDTKDDQLRIQNLRL